MATEASLQELATQPAQLAAIMGAVITTAVIVIGALTTGIGGQAKAVGATI